MKNNIICLFLVIFLLTGCTIKYNLNINKDGIKEIAKISAPLGGLSYFEAENQLDNIIISNISEDGSISNKYKIDKIINTNEYGLELTLNDYRESSFMNGCYSNVNISNDGKNYILQSEGNFNCFNIWDQDYDVEINISVDGKVIESNADSHNGSTYTWKLYDDQSKDIYIKYSLDKKDNNNTISIYIIIGLFVIIVGVVIYFVIRNKKVNEI